MGRKVKYRYHWQGEWHYIEFYEDNLGVKFSEFEARAKTTVLYQYTGFKDRNGVEIYEGSIIEFDKSEWGGDDNIHVVSWDNKEGSWCWGGGSTSDMGYRSVIGNTYENSELLTTK